MKQYLKQKTSNCLNFFVQYKWFWKIYHPIAEINAEVYYKKKLESKILKQDLFYDKYKHLLDDTVSGGPFKGLRYPFQNSLHSTLFPKLLGSYESELHGFLEKAFENKYTSIVDLGCAEGYYAVGLARKFPKSIIYAADLNPEAREMTKLMASFNGVELGENFQILEEVTSDFLMGLDPSQKHFIFSDCEGFEADLFLIEAITHLKKSDFLVEMHEFIFPGIFELLKNRFESTHSITLVKSIDDEFRYREIQNPDINRIPISDQKNLLAEKRPCQMEWIFCQPIISK